MSFGYSSDEFNALFTLAHKVRKELVGAPSQFEEISDKVRSLSIVLQDIDVVSPQSELDKEQRIDLHRILISCRDILIDVEKSVDNDSGPGSSHGDPSKTLKRVGKRNIWEPSDIRDLQDRITTNVELLGPYLKQISNKDSVKSKDNDDQTPLCSAVQRNNVDKVKLLLDRGVNIESKDNNNQTPLWWAARNNQIDMVRLLLYRGADVNSKDKNNQTPLWWAARNSNMAMVKLLLERGANIESKDKNNQTLLSTAVLNNNVDMVKLLLDRGADVGSQDDDQTPLGSAARSSNEDMFKLLLNAGANVESNDNNDQTPTAGPDALREAVGRFDVQAVEDLLTQAFNDVARDDFNWLPELVEIGYGYQDIAKLLVDEKNSPWIFIEPIEISNAAVIMDHHQAFCVHQGGDAVTFSPRLIAEDEAIRHIGSCHKPDLTEMDSIKRHVAKSCGLAGVIPVLNDRQGWIDAVAFDGDDLAVASVAFDLDLSHTTSTIQDCLLRVEAALERLVDIVSWLQQNGLCCNSFTILKLSTEIGRVELIQVPFSLILLLVGKVSDLQSRNSRSGLRCGKRRHDSTLFEYPGSGKCGKNYNS
ncbi:hypothetical protein JMJ35_010609 [Cladonia borealis]|uniref:Ankyrin repeat protein n=1 Tax=Cladonia borealis TaxID=184061 RepID=A0AA39V176_9LECA|nr:hypothetical protein JMJ35_010609 [Cladonia borealis]